MVTHLCASQNRWVQNKCLAVLAATVAAVLGAACFIKTVHTLNTHRSAANATNTTLTRENRLRSLVECHAKKLCQNNAFDTPGWLTNQQACLLYCLGLTAESTVVEQGVFAGKSTLHIAAGLKAAGKGVKLLSHDIFPTRVCKDQPFCWDCNDANCSLKVLDDVPYSMTRSKFDLDRAHLMLQYGSFEKWVLSRLYRYDLLDEVFIVTSRNLVPGKFKYLWLDTAHSCKEVGMNMPGVLASAADDAIFLVHDMGDQENLACLLKALGKAHVQLLVDGLAVI